MFSAADFQKWPPELGALTVQARGVDDSGDHFQDGRREHPSTHCACVGGPWPQEPIRSLVGVLSKPRHEHLAYPMAR